MGGAADLAGPSNGSDSFGIRLFGIRPTVEQIKSASKELADLDDESAEDFRVRLMVLFEQMMFVSGETAEPSTETTGMMEELVKQQVVEMVSWPYPTQTQPQHGPFINAIRLTS